MSSELRVDKIIPTAGVPTGGGGGIIQVVSVTKTDNVSIFVASETYHNYDDASLKVTITPKFATSKILIFGTIHLSVNTNGYATYLLLHKDGSVIDGARGDAEGNRTRALSVVPQVSNDHPSLHSISYLDDAGNTNSRYYNYAFAHGAGGGRSMKINAGYNVSNSFLYSTSASTLTAMEVSA